MRFLWPYVRRQWRRFAWGTLALALTNVALVLFPQFFRVAIDIVQLKGDPSLIREAAILMVVVAVCGAIMRTLSRIHIFYAARDVELEIRDDYYRHLTRQGPGFYLEHSAGDLLTYATSDLTQIRLLFGPALINVFGALFMYASVLPFMLSLSPYLTAVAFGLFLPGLLTMTLASQRMYGEMRAQQSALGRLSSFIQEHLSGQEVVRSFALEEKQAERFAEHNDAYYERALDLAWSRSYLWKLIGLSAQAAMLGALVLGSIEVTRGRLSLGDVVASVEYLALLSWPSIALGWIIGLLQRGKAAIDRIVRVMDAEPAVQDGALKKAPHIGLALAGATVGYQGRAVLRELELEIPAGSTLGIVGPIGGGKSTLVHALIRDVPTLSGTIRLGGHSLDAYSLECLRRQFGFVHQEPLLFSSTIGENVSFGRPDATKEEVLRVLEAAAFGDELRRFPEGLDTVVGERGVTLSGGQKQRLAIARALLLDPPILVLDDALSAVDAETEASILETLEQVRAGRTNIVVAHRLSAVRAADHIIVLENGRVSEEGRHDNLLALGGTYARLERAQRVERALGRRGGEARAGG